MFQEADIDEKEVTTYLFRRNFATTLYGLGLPLSDIQYYLGHDVEDPDTARSHYVNKDKLLAIKTKLDWHPAYAVLGRESGVDRIGEGNPTRQIGNTPGDAFEIKFSQNYAKCLLGVKCREPGDEISLKLSSEENGSVSAVLDARPELEVYDKEVDIRLPVWENFRRYRFE